MPNYLLSSLATRVRAFTTFRSSTQWNTSSFYLSERSFLKMSMVSPLSNNSAALVSACFHRKWSPVLLISQWTKLNCAWLEGKGSISESAIARRIVLWGMCDCPFKKLRRQLTTLTALRRNKCGPSPTTLYDRPSFHRLWLSTFY